MLTSCLISIARSNLLYVGSSYVIAPTHAGSQADAAALIKSKMEFGG